MDRPMDSDVPRAAPSARRKIRGACLFAGLMLQLPLALEKGIAAPVRTTVHPAAVALTPLLTPARPEPIQDAIGRARYRLSPQDDQAYSDAFAALDRQDWTAVDQAISRLADHRLIGHLRAALLLAHKDSADYAALRGWLDLYRDLPESVEIYSLAVARRPADSIAPPKPNGRPIDTPAAEKAEAAPQFDDEPRTEAARRAASRFSADDDSGALTEALKAIETLGSRATNSHWIAGLAAWRLGRLEEAGRHFASLANARTASGWMQAAGAYWAGRVAEQRGIVASATKWFGGASRFPTTFYGMLALRKLGVDVSKRVSGDGITPDHLNTLAETPNGYRAVALLQVGQRELAARELELVDAAGDPRLEEAVIVTAQAAGLSRYSGRLSERIARPSHASGTVQIPSWKPSSGFKVDPALVYALARLESGFDPRALNPSGAAGLMQIMPATARHLVPNAGAALLDPEVNLEIGQRYLHSLMRDPHIGENLFLIAVAYNRGSGNPAQFRRMLDRGDPLLAMESLPSADMRSFIQRVMANYWLYATHMGGDTTSLTDLANDRWPLYRWQKTDQSNATALLDN